MSVHAATRLREVRDHIAAFSPQVRGSRIYPPVLVPLVVIVGPAWFTVFTVFTVFAGLLVLGAAVHAQNATPCQLGPIAHTTAADGCLDNECQAALTGGLTAASKSLGHSRVTLTAVLVARNVGRLRVQRS